MKSRAGKRQREEKDQKKEDADARKGRKVAKHCVFPMIWGSGGSKSRLAKAAGAEPAGQMRDEKLHAVVARSTFGSQNVKNTRDSDHFWKLRCRKSARRCGAKHILKWKCTKHTSVGPLLEVEMSKKCTPLWREAHVEVKMHKAHQVRTTFGSWDVEKVQAHFQAKMYKTPHVRATFGGSDVEKVYAVVARSTFRSQNVQNTTCSRHFWRFRCRKSARRCGAKHISKSKCTKHTRSGPLLVVEMSKKCKHISKSKCTKHHLFAPLLEVRMSKKCTPLWREAHFEVKMYKTLRVRATFGGSDVEKVNAAVARRTLRSKHVQNTRGSDHFWRFRCRFASIHCTIGHYTTLQYTTLHYITLQYTPLH